MHKALLNQEKYFVYTLQGFWSGSQGKDFVLRWLPATAMALCAFRAKLEEHTSGSNVEADPPAKRPCSQFDQQLSKLPEGDLTLVKDPSPKTNVCLQQSLGTISFG